MQLVSTYILETYLGYYSLDFDFDFSFFLFCSQLMHFHGVLVVVGFLICFL